MPRAFKRLFIALRPLAVAWLVCFLAPGCEALAQSASVPPTEASVRAAFLYRFLDYVEWDRGHLEPGQTIVIAVLGNDEMLDEVQRTIAGRRSHEHPIEIRKLSAGDDLTGVQVVYVGTPSSAAIAAMAKRAMAASALLVTNAENALALGSDINFVETDGHVRFEVDLGNVERSGLRLGSGMLSVALRVRNSS